MDGPLARMLAQKPFLLLDGAMGTELQRRGVDTGLPLWSANALVVHPETVQQIHQEYIAAGAEIITTNTFRTTRRIMRRANLPDRSRQLTAQAVELAKRARAAFPEKEVLVAGSIAPLEDCYRPDRVPPERELEEEHAELAGRLAADGVDFILIETMNTMREAYAACKVAVATGKEVIVSFICDRYGELYGGDPFGAAIKALEQIRPTAFSINCVSPRFMGEAVTTLRKTTALPFAVYANVGAPENQKHGWEFTRDISEDDYALYAREWRRNGASIIGGCCGTTPEYIRAVSKALRTL
jgi:S-methylmethionine-dependent homocysteine/selenocysteine methylase